jgi:hypothetical protein
MSERTNKDIEIKDLPPEETLTPEEKERLAGAGRFRPRVEALEAREMMDATSLGSALSSGQGPPAETAHLRNLQDMNRQAPPAASETSATTHSSDNFTRADSTNLGPNWTTVLGQMGISGNQAVGQSGVVDLAQVNGLSLTDTAVSAAVNVGTSGERYGGVFARRDAAGNMYVAILGVNSAANPPGSPTAALLFRFTPGVEGTVNGGWSLLNYELLPTPPNTGSADLRLEVTGTGPQTTLRLYLNGTLTVSFTESQPALSGVSNNTLNGPGGVGLLSIGAGTSYGNFFAGANAQLHNIPDTINIQDTNRQANVQIVQQNIARVVLNNLQTTNLQNLQTTNLQQDMKKAIKAGPIQVRTGPVGAEPKSQRQLDREALDRMLALPVTRPPAGGNEVAQPQSIIRTGGEPGSRPAEPPKGWRKIEVFGPPEGNSTIAVKKGTFYQDPVSGRMIRWS